MESFYSVICAAAANQKKNEELKASKMYSTKVSTAKKEETKKKGILSAGVKAFLEKQKQEEARKAAEENKKKQALLDIRKDAKHIRKMKAMAKNTKDNTKTFTEEELKRSRAEAQERAQRVAEALKLGKHAPMRMVGLQHTKSATARNAKAVKGTITDEFIHDSDSSDDEDNGEERFKVIKEPKEKTVYKGSGGNLEKKDKEHKSRHKEKYKDKDKYKDNDKHEGSREKHHKTSKHDKERISKEKKNSDKEKRREEKRVKKQALKEEQEKVEVKEPPPRPKIKPKFNKPLPPPMSFEQLMCLAAKGASPAEMAAKGGAASAPKDPPKKKPPRPMTADEKASYERRNTKEYRRYLKYGGQRPKFEKHNSSSDSDSDNGAKQDNSQQKSGANSNKPQIVSNGTKAGISDSKNSSSFTTNIAHDRVAAKPTGIPSKPAPLVPKGGYRINPKNLNAAASQCTASPPAKRVKQELEEASYEESNENVLVCRPSNSPPKPEMSTWDRIYGQVHKKKAPPSYHSNSRKRSRVADSDDEESDYNEDEYEEDLDGDLSDFIDDGDQEPDVSSTIKSIFGYDRNKYRNEREDDLSDMETSYSKQMQEERISAKVGLKEDLEDIAREEQHKKKKMQLKKLAVKRRH